MESAGEPKAKLVKVVSQKLDQAGYPVTNEAIDPEDHSPLNRIKELVGGTAEVIGTEFGTTLQEGMSGQGGTTRNKEGEAKLPRTIASIRERLKLKKAA